MLTPLALFLLLVIAHHFSRQLLSLPKRMDYLKCMPVHKPSKDKLLINVLALILTLNYNALDLGLP